MSSYVRHRSRPRISVNKLGEYLAESKSTRRHAILRDQKREVRCRVIQYQAAHRAVTQSLTGSDDPMEALARHLESLKQWAPTAEDSQFAERENRLCQEAIRSFMDILPTLSLRDFTVTRGLNEAPKLRKAGVAISVRPELVLRGTSRQGRPIVGAVKLHFPKTHPLSPDASDYVGVILHEYGQRHLAELEACDYRHCYVIDVPSKQIRTAPKSFVRRRSEVEAACRDIAMLWDSIPDN